MAKYIQGKFRPKNPSKYTGDVTNIQFRSSWEASFCNRCDTDPNIIEWSSEEVVVPYISPLDRKQHRYFVDFKIKVRTVDGHLKTYLVEIKPKKQMIEPKKTATNKATKRYIHEVTTYLVNQAKWSAADIYCQKRGYEFLILNEDDLNIKR